MFFVKSFDFVSLGVERITKQTPHLRIPRLHPLPSPGLSQYTQDVTVQNCSKFITTEKSVGNF